MSKKHLSAKLKYDKRYVYILALILLKDIARKEIIVNDNFLTELTCKTIKKNMNSPGQESLYGNLL